MPPPLIIPGRQAVKWTQNSSCRAVLALVLGSLELSQHSANSTQSTQPPSSLYMKCTAIIHLDSLGIMEMPPLTYGGGGVEGYIEDMFQHRPKQVTSTSVAKLTPRF